MKLKINITDLQKALELMSFAIFGNQDDDEVPEEMGETRVKVSPKHTGKRMK